MSTKKGASAAKASTKSAALEVIVPEHTNVIAVPANKMSKDGTRELRFETVRTVKDKDGNERQQVRCGDCGKWLFKDTAVEQGEGHYCQTLRTEKGYTDADLDRIRQEKTVPEPPKGWVKVAALHKICVKNGIPVSCMVRAFGGDRGIEPVLNSHWNFLYSGNSRWLDPYCATEEGLNELRSMAGKKIVKTGEAKSNGKAPKGDEALDAALTVEPEVWGQEQAA